MAPRKVTLDEFRLAELRLLPLATGELSNLLREIGLAAKRIHAEVRHGGLRDIFGSADQTNFSGETTKKLDRFANDELMGVLRSSVSCAGAASEEEDEVLIFDNSNNNNSKYVVMFDPIDGSGNIENGMPVGTIFGIYKRTSTIGGPCLISAALKASDWIEQVSLNLRAASSARGKPNPRPTTIILFADFRVSIAEVQSHDWAFFKSSGK